MQSNIQTFLSRLTKVKRTGQGRWQACCPAHEDRDPSLSIAETKDGSILLHCHAGCEPLAVVHAVDLELKDLFPERENLGPMWWAKQKRRQEEQKAVDIDKARDILQMASSMRANGETLTSKDLELERQAFFAVKRARA